MLQLVLLVFAISVVRGSKQAVAVATAECLVVPTDDFCGRRPSVTPVFFREKKPLNECGDGQQIHR
jgi:hypothetical protein